MKPAPWYAWIDIKGTRCEDSCITTLPIKERIAIEKYNNELPDTLTDWKRRHLNSQEEVIGCSEWMRAEDEDFEGIVAIRNNIRTILDVLDKFRVGDAAIVEDIINAFKCADEKMAFPLIDIGNTISFLERVQNMTIKMESQYDD
jgi:hypothetical protein